MVKAKKAKGNKPDAIDVTATLAKVGKLDGTKVVPPTPVDTDAPTALQPAPTADTIAVDVADDSKGAQLLASGVRTIGLKAGTYRIEHPGSSRPIVFEWHGQAEAEAVFVARLSPPSASQADRGPLAGGAMPGWPHVSYCNTAGKVVCKRNRYTGPMGPDNKLAAPNVIASGPSGTIVASYCGNKACPNNGWYLFAYLPKQIRAFGSPDRTSAQCPIRVL
jgi:hypothetical protein